MNIIQMRRGMGASGEPLPYDAQIEYLESSGSQSIILEYYLKGDTSKLEVKYSGFANKLCGIGARNNYNSNAFGLWNGGSVGNRYSVLFFNYNATWRDLNGVWTNDSTVRTVKLDNKCIIDNAIVSSYNIASFNVGNPLAIFAYRPNLTASYTYLHMRVYYYKIFESDTLAMDFIPVRIGQTGYLYDTISGQLFGNSGTGDFTLGPDVQ